MLTQGDIDYLVSEGLDPNEYDLDATGDNYVPKFAAARQAITQPAVTGTEFPHPKLQTMPGETFGPLGTAAGTFAHQAPSTIAGGYAFGKVAGPVFRMTPGPPIAKGAASIFAGTAAAMGLGGLTSSIQSLLENPFVEAANNSDATASIFSKIGRIINKLKRSQAENPKSAIAGGIATMPLAGMNPSLPNVGKAAQYGLPWLLTAGKMRPPPEQMPNILNVGIGGALQPAIATGRALATGEDITWQKLLGETALGLVFNKPNALGRAYGFSDVSPTSPLPDEQTMLAAYKPVDAMRGFKESPFPAQEELARMEGEGGLVERAEPDTRIEEFMAAMQELRDQQARQAAQPAPVAPAKSPAKAAAHMRSRLGQKATPEAIMERGIGETETMPDPLYYERLPDGSLIPVRQPELPTKILPTEPTEAELAQERLESTPRAREFRQDEPSVAEGRPRTAFEEQISDKTGQAFKAAVIKPEGVKAWNDKLFQWLKDYRGVDEVVSDPNLPSAGQAAITWFKDNLRKVVVKLNPNKAGFDTPIHEGVHPFLDALEHGSGYDKMIVKKLYKTIEGSPEFKAINDARIAQGRAPWDANEFLTSETASEFINKQLKFEGDTEFKTWWKDVVNHIKVRFGKELTTADVRRFANYRFQTDAPFKQAVRSGAEAALTSGRVVEQDEPSMTREKASAIAKDLIEGGINAKQITKLTAETHGVSIDTVRNIRRILLKGGNNIDNILSYDDAIRNGWEDAALGLHNQDEPSVQLNNPAIRERIEEVIGGLKDGTVTTDSARELKGMLLQGVVMPDSLRAALDSVDSGSMTSWIQFRAKLRNTLAGKLPPDAPKNVGAELEKAMGAKVVEPVAPVEPTPAKPAKSVVVSKETGVPVEPLRSKTTVEPVQNAEAQRKLWTKEWDEINTTNDPVALSKIVANKLIKAETPRERAHYLAQYQYLVNKHDVKNMPRLQDEPSIRFEDDFNKLPYKDQGKIRAQPDEGRQPYPFTMKELEKGEELRDTFEPSELSRTEYNSDEPSIYEKGVGKLLTPLAPEIEKIRAHSPEGKVAAKGLTEFYRSMSRLRGELEQRLIRNLWKIRGSRNLEEFWKQDNEDFRAVVKWRDLKQDGKDPGFELTPVQKEISAAIDESNKLSHTMREAYPELAHYTSMKLFYLAQTMSREAAIELSEHPISKKSIQYYKDFVRYQKEQNGLNIDEAQNAWETVRGAFTKESHNLAQQFGPIDEASGIGLPISMREQNLMDRYSRFNRRYARRIAYHMAIEKNPEVMDALFNKQHGLESTQETKNVLEDIYGVREHIEAKRNAVLGIIRAGMLGPLTGFKDFVSNLTLGLQHQDASQVIPAIASAFRDYKANYERAINKGSVRYAISALEMGEGGYKNIEKVLQRARDVINTVQGRQFLETATRITAFGQGRYLAIDALTALRNKRLSFQKTKFLKDFVPGWEKYRDAAADEAVINEAAANYVDSVQGTYDYRGQPNITMKGTFAPILSLARWNVEKFNNFVKYNVEPAKQGNWKPLLMSTIGMLVGGTAVTALVEAATGRKDRTPSWKEISASDEQVELAAYKLAGLSSMAGYAGIMGDLFRSGMDFQFKNRPQIYNNPLIDGLATATENLGFLIEAMQQGDIPAATDVLHQVLQDYFQAYRLGVAHLSPEAKEDLTKRAKMRDLKMFKAGQGLPLSPYSSERPNPFVDKELRDFKKTDDMGEAMQLLPSLLEKAVSKAEGDPERLKSELLRLKLNNYQTMPNPETLPKRFYDYYLWLAETQGEAEASARLADYLTQNAINKAKSEMIP